MNMMSQDHSDRGEDFSPEGPKTPEEYKVCGYCTFYDARMEPFVVHSAAGDELEGRYCDCDQEQRYPTRTLVEFETNACRYFVPNAAAQAAAVEAAEYERNPYAANGVDQRDFY